MYIYIYMILSPMKINCYRYPYIIINHYKTIYIYTYLYWWWFLALFPLVTHEFGGPIRQASSLGRSGRSRASAVNFGTSEMESLEVPGFIWAMVNTHYMVDGHPIHIKDPKIMVIINPILNHWMTSPYQWLLTTSIDHSSYGFMMYNQLVLQCGAPQDS